MRYLKIVLKLLEQKHRKQLMRLQLVFLIGATLQILSIASMAPFIALISDAGAFSENQLFNSIISFLDLDSRLDILIFFATLVVSLILVNNCYSAIALRYLFKYSVDVGLEIQSRLYRNYVHQPYIFFSKNSSPQLIANITSEVPRFVYMVVQPILHIASELFVALLIIMVLIYVDPIMAIATAVFIGSIYILIYRTIRNRVQRNGELISKVAKKKIKVLNESIGGIKEIKMLGAEEIYRKELYKTTASGLNASAFNALAGDLPRFIVETCVFGAILILAIFLILKFGDSTTTMSVLSLYVMAGYKLMPAIQTIYKSVACIKANGGVAAKLFNEISRTNNYVIYPDKQAAEIFDSLELSLDKISYRYPDTNSDALKNINIEIKQNTVVAFVGASGAGKSTIVDILLGLLSPTTGSISVGGQKIDENTVRNWQSLIGYVPQDIFLLDDSIKNNIAYGVPESQIDFERVISAAKKAKIHEYICGQKDGYDFVVGERGIQLSGGQVQRIGIARALYHNPRYIIFDEATSALDTLTERSIIEEVLSLKSSANIIMIAHRLSTVLNADKIFYLNDGTIEDSGTFEELKIKNANFGKLAEVAGL